MMTRGDQPSRSLSGSILLASPEVKDNPFSRAVILLAAHQNEDGAFGYILNKPLDKVASEVVTEDLDLIADTPIFYGGPVNTDKLAFASLKWDDSKRLLQIETHLTTDQAISAKRKGLEIRAFVGYSGWSEGQLENELAHETWIVCECPDRRTMQSPSHQLWKAILREMGPTFLLLAEIPTDSTLN